MACIISVRDFYHHSVMYVFPHPWQKYKGFRLLCYFQAFVLYVFFPQILQAEKDNQEMQHQLQLSELMNKHAKEMRDLG